MYIKREIQPYLISQLKTQSRVGFMISGIVGCGKTTLIEMIRNELQNTFTSFYFTGDDSNFRQSVSDNSRFLLEEIAKQTYLSLQRQLRIMARFSTRSLCTQPPQLSSFKFFIQK